MNIDSKKLAEIVGVTAVVLSLLFVGYELRLARSVAESESLAESAELYRSLREYISSNSEVWEKGCLAKQLSSSESIKFANMALSIMNYNFAQWNRSLLGIRGGPGWANIIAVNRYNFPGFNRVWEEMGSGSSAYREAVNARYSFVVESGTSRNSDVAYCGV